MRDNRTGFQSWKENAFPLLKLKQIHINTYHQYITEMLLETLQYIRIN